MKRRAFALTATAGIAAALALVLSGCDRPIETPPPSTERPSQRPPPTTSVTTSVTTSSAAAFPRRLVDVTARSGIRFRHVTGGYGDKLLPETLGSGAALLDFDGDGALDIFFVNSTHWPGHAPPGAPAPACALYRGRGDGTFTDVSAATGADVSLYGMGCTAADYDGDGDTDIYVTALGDNVLLENDAGRFEDVTVRAGVAGGRWRDRDGESRPEWSTAAAWADLDLDGDLDLLVANYVEWSPGLEIFATLDGKTKVFTTPDRYPGLPCRLFLNRGDGRFEDASGRVGLEALRGKALGLALWDFDGNGLLDIVVANDTRPNFLLFNERGPRLVERGLELGIAYDSNGRARAGMGIDVADVARAGTPVVAIGNFSEEPVSLYRWHGETGFAAIESEAGVAGPTYGPLAFGVAFADLDLDGIDDLVVVNGHIEPEIARFRPGETHAQRAQLFQGLGDGTFRDASSSAGAGFATARVGRGLAAGDVDGDGDLDLLITTNGGPPALLRNDHVAGEAPRFLRVRLRDNGENTDAIGALVRVTSGGATQTRLVRTGSSYLSQSELTVTFGLGSSESIERLEVIWPDGNRTTHTVEALDSTVEIRRP